MSFFSSKQPQQQLIRIRVASVDRGVVIKHCSIRPGLLVQLNEINTLLYGTLYLIDSSKNILAPTFWVFI